MKKILDNYRDLYVLTEGFQIKNIGDGSGRTVGKILNPFLGRGYLRVRLSRGQKVMNFSVHRIIAEELIPNPDNLPQVNHKDGNKLNNHPSNLEWCTASENSRHAVDTGLRSCDHNKRLMLNLDTGIFYESMSEASFSLGRNQLYMSNVIRKNRNHTGLVLV